MPSGRKRSGLTPVQEIIGSVFSRLDSDQDLERKGMVFHAWDAVAGEAAGHARPFRFRGSTLIVEVTSSVWLTELSMNKSEILARLKRAAGSEVIQDIRFQIKRKRRED